MSRLERNQCTRCYQLFTPQRRTDAVCDACAGERARLNARRTDPSTSHEAARRMEASGAAQTHRERVMAIIRQRHGLTAHEIADRLGDMDNVAVQRRISDLVRDGLLTVGEARPCPCHGRSMTTWGLAPSSPVGKPEPVQVSLL